MAEGSPRGPNILITGTPGTGKTTLGSEVSQRVGFNYINVGDVAKQHDLYDGWDDKYQCPVLDEDRVCTMFSFSIFVMFQPFSYIIDVILTGTLDIVFVLRTNNNELYERLEKRGYSGKKLEENIQCEIFQTILDEAREAYKPQIVHELPSNTPDEMEDNLDKILAWIEQWTISH
ncbi:adenylate kinase isoenzyme 6-like [Haliotis rubra]|uniref:adenylate kinase isoenzyme 6-like n=1 Tax=Haliotis rubra TaxID=36100 RepID=UPI001EE62AD2|nr:adenylate kinase isoenzyme 6-like [Haliotis rubra]